MKRVLLSLLVLFLTGCQATTVTDNTPQLLTPTNDEYLLMSANDEIASKSYTIFCDIADVLCGEQVDILLSNTAQKIYFIDIKPYLDKINDVDAPEGDIARSVVEFKKFISVHQLIQMPAVYYIEDGQVIDSYFGYVGQEYYEQTEQAQQETIVSARQQFTEWVAGIKGA